MKKRNGLFIIMLMTVMTQGRGSSPWPCEGGNHNRGGHDDDNDDHNNDIITTRTAMMIARIMMNVLIHFKIIYLIFITNYFTRSRLLYREQFLLPRSATFFAGEHCWFHFFTLVCTLLITLVIILFITLVVILVRTLIILPLSASLL